MSDYDTPEYHNDLDLVAFYGSRLTALEIPPNVTSLDSKQYGTYPSSSGNPFAGTEIKVTVALGNTHFSAQDGMLFNQDKTVLYHVPFGLDEINLPNGLVTISEKAIGCIPRVYYSDYPTMPRIIKIPDGVTTISGGNFMNWGNMGASVVCAIVVPNSVTNWYHNMT